MEPPYCPEAGPLPVCFVYGECDVGAVHEAEDAHRGPGQPLVAVYQSVATSQRVHQRDGLLRKGHIGVNPEGAGLGSCGRGRQQAKISHLHGIDYLVADLQEIL